MTEPATKPARTPRGTLNVDRIVETAITMIDRDGLDGLTIARLAGRLGVTPMSLYTHFRDKEAILRGVAGALFERLEMPPRNDLGIEHIREVLRAYFRLLVENPVLLRLDAAFERIADSEARMYEELYTCTDHLGFDTRSAVGIVATFMRYVSGAAFVHGQRHQRDDDDQYWSRYRVFLASLSPVEYPMLNRMRSAYLEWPQSEAFEFGLDLLLRAVDSSPRGPAAAPAD